jgi:protein-disulfide isomerase
MSSRDRARTKANATVRAQLAKEKARRRNLIVSIVAAVTLVVAGLIGWGVYQSQRPSGYRTPAHATANGDGLVVGAGPVTVDIYLDFMCPHCQRFEQDAGVTLKQLVADSKIKAVYHPVAFLDQASSTRYSTRSSAAAACAADSDVNKLLAYIEALYAQQPPENSAGLSNDKLVEIGASVGLTDSKFATCVRDGTYQGWAAHVTDVAVDNGVHGTPTVRVNGKDVDATASALNAAVAQG